MAPHVPATLLAGVCGSAIGPALIPGTSGSCSAWYAAERCALKPHCGQNEQGRCHHRSTNTVLELCCGAGTVLPSLSFCWNLGCAISQHSAHLHIPSILVSTLLMLGGAVTLMVVRETDLVVGLKNFRGNRSAQSADWRQRSSENPAGYLHSWPPGRVLPLFPGV